MKLQYISIRRIEGTLGVYYEATSPELPFCYGLGITVERAIGELEKIPSPPYQWDYLYQAKPQLPYAIDTAAWDCGMAGHCCHPGTAIGTMACCKCGAIMVGM